MAWTRLRRACLGSLCLVGAVACSDDAGGAGLAEQPPAAATGAGEGGPDAPIDPAPSTPAGPSPMGPGAPQPAAMPGAPGGAGPDPGPGASTADAGTPGAAPAPGMSAGGADAGMGPGASQSPGLPPVDDPGETGPFEIEVVESLDGLPTHGLIAPRDLGRDGLKHPIVVWINGAGANFSSYRNMLDNVAAHGFFLIDDKQSTFEAIPEIESQRAAIDWALAQNEDPASPYHDKLDVERIAIGGHSLGSVASFGNVGDPRITTSIHMAGGVIGNPGGVDESNLDNLRAPTAFLCGSRDTNGLPRVRNDFAGAPPEVPLFFGILDGVGHTDEFNQPNGGRWGRVVLAWLRWHLADDTSMQALFMGDTCEFCTGDWTAMKRGLD